MENNEGDVGLRPMSIPRATPLEAARPPVAPDMGIRPSDGDMGEDARTTAGVFAQLVRGDDDIAGLVAYSIYKQHKLDWLQAFEQAKGRKPDGSELASYIIGEATPRRLATYRHLAEATLIGKGPGSKTTAPTGRDLALRGDTLGPSLSALTPSLIAIYAIIAVMFVVGFWYALHFTMVSR